MQSVYSPPLTNKTFKPNIAVYLLRLIACTSSVSPIVVVSSSEAVADVIGRRMPIKRSSWVGARSPQHCLARPWYWVFPRSPYAKLVKKQHNFKKNPKNSSW